MTQQNIQKRNEAIFISTNLFISVTILMVKNAKLDINLLTYKHDTTTGTDSYLILIRHPHRYLNSMKPININCVDQYQLKISVPNLFSEQKLRSSTAQLNDDN